MNLKKFSLVAFAATVLVATSSVAAYAELAVATDYTKVREYADKHSDKVSSLYAGELVDVVDCDYGWCYVEHDGDDGWVKKNKLDFDVYTYGGDVDVGFEIYADGNGVSFGLEIFN